MTNIFNKGFDTIIKYAQSKDMGKVLAYTGALGWVLSCMAYTGAILLNKEIPDDQKKFLIPQELADGFINAGIFLFLTSKANKKAQELVKEGRFLPKQIKDEVLSLRAKYGNDIPFEQIASHLSEKSVKKLSQFKKSFPALISIIGSVIASNIVTPIGRNIFASKFQKKHIANDSKTTEEKTRPMQQKTTVINVPVLNSYTAYTKGGMKI